MTSSVGQFSYNPRVGLGEEIDARLRALSAAGPVEVRDGHRRLASLATLSWELRGTPTQPLVHLWSEEHNLTRRVLAIAEDAEDRLILSVQRFGKAKPGRLEFLRVDFERSAREMSREEFCGRLEGLLAQQFPDEELESLTIAPDLKHSLSGNYARGILRRGKIRWAVLGMPAGTSPGTEHDVLTFALLWLDHVRHAKRAAPVAGLRIILPRICSAAVAHRLGALDAKIPLELYELDPIRETLARLDPAKIENLASWLVPHREAEALLARAAPRLHEVFGGLPAAVALHPLVDFREVVLRFRGLSFARWEEDRVFFGVPDARQEWTSASQPALNRLLHDLDLYRNPLASDTFHVLYRAQPERWLESLVRADLTQVDASLDSRFVYSQVFASAGGEYGVIDLLGATRGGRLAILELKADEHIHLPLQAADYWLRVRRHQLQGDFPRYGYFPGIELQPAPPLVYLVAPAIRFHPATGTLLQFLSPEITVFRVGLAENWRRGIRVVMRQ